MFGRCRLQAVHSAKERQRLQCPLFVSRCNYVRAILCEDGGASKPHCESGPCVRPFVRLFKLP